MTTRPFFGFLKSKGRAVHDGPAPFLPFENAAGHAGSACLYLLFKLKNLITPSYRRSGLLRRPLRRGRPPGAAWRRRPVAGQVFPKTFFYYRKQKNLHRPFPKNARKDLAGFSSMLSGSDHVVAGRYVIPAA